MKIKDIGTYIQLNNGVKMPLLGLGVYKTKEGKEVREAIHYAFEAGYRHIDTASYYENEEGVGQAIKSSNIPREEIFLTTKVWNDEQGNEKTLRAFDNSLKKLGLEYVDLYLIHWPVPGKYLETWRAFEKIHQEGRARAIGVCNCLQHHLEDFLSHSEIKPMVLQNEFHPRLIQQDLIKFCKENEIQYEGWSPLMRGRILQNETLKDLASHYRKTIAQIILRWHLQKGVVVIPKSVHKNRIQENADVFDFELNTEDMRVIDSLDRGERTGAHPDNFVEHFRGK